MAVLAPFVFWQLFDNNGDPLSGGQVETYEAGTSTPKQTFVDADETSVNTNPVILDSAGRADIWLDEGAYKFILKDSSGNTIATVDDFSGDAAGAIVTYYVTSNLDLTSIYDNANVIGDGTFTVNLLPVADAEDGFQFRVYNEGSGVITIDPNSTETINNATTIDIPAASWAQIYCTGTEWFALNIGTLALQDADSVDIDGGAIDGVTLGTNSAVTEAQVDNININGNTIRSTDTDGDLVIDPNGSGVVDVNTSLISNVTDPSSAQDAATKNYVDSLRQLPKAWATVSVSGGTPSLDDSYNVTSITDEGTGDLTITFTNNMANTDYSVLVTVERVASGRIGQAAVRTGGKAVGSVRVVNFETTGDSSAVVNPADPISWNVVIFGDLA